MRSLDTFSNRQESIMKALIQGSSALSLRTLLVVSLGLGGHCAFAQATRPSPETDMYAPANSTKLMPNAAVGRQYPTHSNQQAGELNLNPTDPRAQLVNGLPNNSQSGGYGSPLAGNKA